MNRLLIGLLLVIWFWCVKEGLLDLKERPPDDPQHNQDEVQHRQYVPNTPTTRARDRLLMMHPDWKGIAADADFSMRGYFVKGSNVKVPRLALTDEVRPHSILGAPVKYIQEFRDHPGLSEDKWKGVVYARIMWKDDPSETPGWHGPRILIKDDCLFFGDAEMLKQIDTALGPV